MEWVDRLQEATGWREPEWGCDWAETESALSTQLPADYKELCDRFGPGVFSSSHFKPGDFAWHLRVMSDRGYYPLLHRWRSIMEAIRPNPNFGGLYSPHGYYGENGLHGLLRWGDTDTNWYFFWLADAAVDPDAWPVMAKYDMDRGEDWLRYEMTVSEFVYRVVTDPGFYPFGMAYPGEPPVCLLG